MKKALAGLCVFGAVFIALLIYITRWYPGTLGIVASWVPIIGFMVALIIALLTATGYLNAYRIRIWFRYSVWLGVFKYGRLRRGYSKKTIETSDLIRIPGSMVYDDFNPNDIQPPDSIDQKGKYFRLTASIKEKKKEERVGRRFEICDWKGVAFTNDNALLNEIYLKVRAYIHQDMNEWKLGISVLDNDHAVDPQQEHRLYGEGRTSFEISRHHEEGVQAIASVFNGHPYKVRSSAIKEGDWNDIRVIFKKERILFYIFGDEVCEIDTRTKPNIDGFKPDSLWFVFWADKPTEMEVRFADIKTYWHKD